MLAQTSGNLVANDARDVAPYYEFDARDFAELDTRDFQNKINSEQHMMNQEAQRIKAQQQRLQNQQKDVSLQEQIHKDRKALRNDRAFSSRDEIDARGFQNKITTEQHTMNREAIRIKAEQQRLQNQQKEVSLQEQIHNDRNALRKNKAF